MKYVFINIIFYPFTGLRKVYPYYFTFTTFTKGRWVGEKILDVFAKEFRAHPAEEYVSHLITMLMTLAKLTRFYLLERLKKEQSCRIYIYI